MPLTMAEIGKVSVINRVNGNEETRRFLGNLGFVAGTEVTVLSEMGGNVIVSIKKFQDRGKCRNGEAYYDLELKRL